jgi:colicin import membrane protein
MTEPAPRASRRLQSHKPPRGMGPAFLLSILAHALLILAIAFAVRWNIQPVGPVSVELWGGAPPPVTAAPPPPAPAPPPPPPRIEPEPERPADIVLEPKKAPPKPEPKKEEPKKPPPPDPKIEEKRIADAKAAEAKAAEAKRIADAKAAEAKKIAEAKAAEAKLAAERHEAELKRITAAAAGPVTGPVAAAGITSGYRSQIVACIRPHIVFAVPDGVRPGQYVAEFEVLLAPTGEQLGAPKLLKSSGIAPYDQAVERAIRRCDPFPRPADGAMPRTLQLKFDPVETR